MSDDPLPPGWSKHWSNTWKKHYWFHAKSGKQSWDPPSVSDAAAGDESTQPATAGSKRGPENTLDEQDHKQHKPETVAQSKIACGSENKNHSAESFSGNSPAEKRPAPATIAAPAGEADKIKKASTDKNAKEKVSLASILPISSQSHHFGQTSKSGGSLLGSLLGSIGSLESQQQSTAAAEARYQSSEIPHSPPNILKIL